MAADTAAIARGVTRAVREFLVERFSGLDRSIGEFEGRLKSLEDRIAHVKDGAPGKDGKDVDPTVIASLTSELQLVRGELSARKTFDDLPAMLVDNVAGVRDTIAQLVKSELVNVRVPQDGKDGKDADPEQIKALIGEQLATWPKPQDGASVTVQDVTPVIQAEVAKHVGALPVPKDGRDGARGADGTSVTVEDVVPVIQAEVAKQVAALPPAQDGKDGAPGANGASVTVDDVKPLIVDVVKAAIAEIPKPQDGKSVTVEDVQPLIEAEVSKHVAAIPIPQDGKDGKDGVSMAGALIDREGTLVVTLSNGDTKSLGRVVGSDGKDGANGSNGQDGINVDFWSTEITRSFDPETRMVTDRYVSGERVKEVTWKMDGALVYRGVYQPSQTYEMGDVVTYGHVWVAKESTSVKPDEHSPAGRRAWQMIMRRGADGKVGPPGPPGNDGKDGKDGLDRWQP